MPAEIRAILQEYWGYDQFRDLQPAIINSVLSGKDTLALLPTGGGKSICYQVPGLASDGVCLVISPLIALMKDQVQQLRRRGISALAIHTGMSFREISKTLEMAVNEQIRFLYLSPERIQTRLFQDYLPSMHINLLAIDEAHCVSQWGYDFRPAYLQISSLVQSLPRVPILALTASATPLVQQDIAQQLGLREPAIFKGSFARPGLSYSCFEETDKWKKLAHILQQVGGCGIVYCKTRKKTAEISRYLNNQGISATHYHAGLPADERNERQQQWMNNQQRVMVSTNAFGMGIDKADVRTVVHVDVPDCLENYYQEAGRAGRDREKSYAVLLYNQQDLAEMDKQLELKFPTLETVQQVYRNLVHYLQIPEGPAEGLTWDFDLAVFCERFQVDRITCIQSLQVLQTYGYCALNEAVFQPSTLQVIASRADLEAIEQQYPQLDPLLKTVLRTYEGLFNYPVSISESWLSKTCRTDRESIQQQLEQLQYLGILRYERQKDKPQLVLLAERMQPGHIRIDKAAREERKKLARERMAAMTSFIGSDRCRSVIIGRYFGDETITDCGICDNCRRKKKTPGNVSAVAEQVMVLLQSQHSGTVAGLREKLTLPCSDDTWWAALQWLESAGRIKTGSDGLLQLS